MHGHTMHLAIAHAHAARDAPHRRRGWLRPEKRAAVPCRRSRRFDAARSHSPCARRTRVRVTPPRREGAVIAPAEALAPLLAAIEAAAERAPPELSRRTTQPRRRPPRRASRSTPWRTPRDAPAPRFAGSCTRMGRPCTSSGRARASSLRSGAPGVLNAGAWGRRRGPRRLPSASAGCAFSREGRGDPRARPAPRRTRRRGRTLRPGQ